MTQRWYESRMNQAAAIGGFFVLAAAIAGSFFAARRPPDLTELEIRTRVGGAQAVLTRIALDPEAQLVDSATFQQLASNLVIVTDSFGVAIAKPDEYYWTLGEVGRPSRLSILDVPTYGLSVRVFMSLFGPDTLPALRSFGVRLDTPLHLEFTNRSTIDGLAFTRNPYDDDLLLDRALDALYDGDLSDVPPSELGEMREYFRSVMDSIIAADLTKETRVDVGVFVTPVDEKNLRASGRGAFKRQTLLDDAVVLLNNPFVAPTFLYVDREGGMAAFNHSVVLEDVLVDGVTTAEAVLNRVGYVVDLGGRAYLIELQYLSTQPESTLRDLQGFFRSVRILR